MSRGYYLLSAFKRQGLVNGSRTRRKIASSVVMDTHRSPCPKLPIQSAKALVYSLRLDDDVDEHGVTRHDARGGGRAHCSVQWWPTVEPGHVPMMGKLWLCRWLDDSVLFLCFFNSKVVHCGCFDSWSCQREFFNEICCQFHFFPNDEIIKGKAHL